MDKIFPYRSSSIMKQSLFQLYVNAYSHIKPFLISHPMFDSATRRIRRSMLTVLIPNRILKERIPNPYLYHGLEIHYRPSDEGDFHIILSLVRGGYEEETVRVLSENLQPGQTFVDLGAHLGLYSLLVARMINPGGRIFAFEPDLGTVELLENNVVSNGMQHLITIIPKAVHSSSGRLYLYRSKGRSDSSSLNPRNRDQEGMEIEATNLDQFFASMNWPMVHCIKMDIEGSEMAALQGMRQLVLKNHYLKLILEINYNRILEAGNTLEEIMELLMEIGFSTFQALHPGWGYINFPEDMPRFLRLVKHYNVNIFCEIK